MTKKNNEDLYEDDGRVIANMNVPGMPGYKSEKETKNTKEIKNLDLSKKEKNAITKAAVSQYLITALICILALCFAFLIIYLWLS